MNRILAIIAMAAFAMPAAAQVNNNSTSGSSSVSGSDATANTSNAINFNSSAPESQTVTYAGDYKVRSAPGTVIGGFAGSFSSDYCSGTAQIGASWLGGSIGGGKPVVDYHCQRLRRVERFGQLAASVGGEATPLGRKLNQMAIYEVCVGSEDTMEKCKTLGLVVEPEDSAAWEPGRR